MTGKTILVTGGTGTFGTAFCRRLLGTHPTPEKVIVLSRGWIAQQELRRNLGDPTCMRWFVGDVRDLARLRRAFNGVDYVIHAAALKDIVSAQYNPREAFLTNTYGTQNVIDAALDCGVEKVVFISSDKAVGASSCYGKTKALAEELIVQGNAYAGRGPTRFCAVRYGNVIGSAGSVVEVFRSQAAIGRLTITDKRMTRFWLPIGKGVDLVLTALESMIGGEIFVPKIPSMKVIDLAMALCPGCEQIEIGIRPGEKLHETLISADESRDTLDRGNHYVICPNDPQWETDYVVISQRLRKIKDRLWEYRSDTNTQWISAEELLK